MQFRVFAKYLDSSATIVEDPYFE
ncbi:hypothetical protein PC112_g24098, partial [Phytophthora cactorum]